MIKTKTGKLTASEHRLLLIFRFLLFTIGFSVIFIKLFLRIMFTKHTVSYLTGKKWTFWNSYFNAQTIRVHKTQKSVKRACAWDMFLNHFFTGYSVSHIHKTTILIFVQYRQNTFVKNNLSKYVRADYIFSVICMIISPLLFNCVDHPRTRTNQFV